MAEHGPHITCQEVVELITDYLEAALSADEAALFEQHINFCEGCVWYVQQMRTTIRTVGRASPPPLPDETRDQLLTVFRDWKRS
jgi:anti-sigma factor RsiW